MDYLSTDQNQLAFSSVSTQNVKQILAGGFTQTLCGIVGTGLAPLREPLSRVGQHEKPRKKRLVCLTATHVLYLTTPQREKGVSATADRSMREGEEVREKQRVCTRARNESPSIPFLPDSA